MGLMIRYSSYGRTNYRQPTPSERALAEECRERAHLDSLAEEYRELQELRERVKRAEDVEPGPASQLLRAVLATLNEDIEFAPKCLLPRRSGEAVHLAQARQIEPRIGRAHGLGRKILCRDRVNRAGLHRLSPRL